MIFAIIGEGSCFCSTVTGLLGRTALGAKKKFWFLALSLERGQSWPGGVIGVARSMVGAFLLFVFGFWNNYESVLLTSKRLG